MTQIAAQLFTIRDFTKTREDFAASMAKIRDIGYQAVQVSQIGDIADADVKRICDDNGLTICNTHASVDDLLREARCGDRAAPAMGRASCGDRGHAAGISRERSWIPALSPNRQWHRRAAACAGLTFSYHNHSFEFLRFGARSGLELIFDETDPRYVQAELDTYWIQHGGADPVVWIERMQDRMPVVHLKDMVMLPGR